jgi:hypothetical protein
MTVLEIRSETQAVRELLLGLLGGAGAHVRLDEAAADFPVEAMNRRAPNLPYTPWHLLEHLRRTQRDILDYVRDREYKEPHWPKDYWPARSAVAMPAEFADTLAAFHADQTALRDLVRDPDVDPLATIPGTPDHTLAREIRLVADHNAYHIGEFAILRSVMGTWPADRRTD